MVVAKAIWDQIPLRSKVRQGNAIARVVTTLLLASFFLAGNVEAQLLTVNDAESNSLTAQDLLDKLLTGSNAVGSSPIIHGAAEAIGIFDQGGSIGLTEGVILGTGNVNGAVGPNDTEQHSGLLNPAICFDGDPGEVTTFHDLLFLHGGFEDAICDAVSLDFDFVCSDSNTASVQYVFASEEYPEFITQFGDLMALFIDGTNVALVNGDPVNIDNVNSGFNPHGVFGAGSLPATNPQFHVDNNLSHPGPPVNLNVQADGYTTVLIAEFPVTAGLTHHMRVAIADAFDTTFDSWVMLEAGGFQCGEGPPDPDGDGIPTNEDNCPSTANADQANFDDDSEGDACDLDDDNDGTPDVSDAFPFNASEDTDTDGDGVGNNHDLDDDDDGLPDALEAAISYDPLSTDGDGNGIEDFQQAVLLVQSCASRAAPALLPPGVGLLVGLLIGSGVSRLRARRAPSAEPPAQS